VTVSLIDWEAEPGREGDAGRPTATALPDFTLLINPEDGVAGGHRSKLATFDR
jgi:hypothetical protein